MSKSGKEHFIRPEMGVFIGVLSVSFAAIFVRFNEAPPIIIAFYRLLFSVPLFTFIALKNNREELKSISKKNVVKCGLAGFFLALHFVTWFASLKYTSVASSLVLVTCHPILIIFASKFLFKEQIGKKSVTGVIIAFIGCIVISGGDYSFSGTALYGDILAFIGAICMALYLITGRTVRMKISASVYIMLIYLSCLLVLFLGVIITKTPFTGYSATDFISFLALALICHSLGHGLFNWALAYVSPTFVSTAIIGEVAGSVILAALILKEIPTYWQILGGIITVVGIVYYNVTYKKPIESNILIRKYEASDKT